MLKLTILLVTVKNHFLQVYICEKKLHSAPTHFLSPLLASSNFPSAEQKWRELQEKKRSISFDWSQNIFLGLGQKLIDVSRKSLINITGFGFWGIWWPRL